MITCTIVYNNDSADNRLRSEWGFACLVEGMGKTLLFDTGGEAEVLAANFKTLRLNPKRIDTVVISHMHWDHINGLQWLAKENPELTVYLPQAEEDREVIRQTQEQFANTALLIEPTQIAPGIRTTGILPGRKWEQALCFESPNGLIVITGCSHPGIVNLLEQARSVSRQNLYAVFGGFHLKNDSPEQIDQTVSQIQSLGIEKIGPTHCTGDAAVDVFTQRWNQPNLPVQLGSRFSL